MQPVSSRLCLVTGRQLGPVGETADQLAYGIVVVEDPINDRDLLTRS